MVGAISQSQKVQTDNAKLIVGLTAHEEKIMVRRRLYERDKIQGVD